MTNRATAEGSYPATKSDETSAHHPTTIELTMFLQRSAFAAARRAAVSPIVKRSFTSSIVRRKYNCCYRATRSDQNKSS
jgi:hypothetical protein